MVTVSGYKIRQNKSGESFIALDLTGSLEIIQSQNTGNMYATVRRCSIPSSFNEEVAKMMVGSRIEGEIVRVPCDPYEYTVKRTGEVIQLGYSYSFRPPNSETSIGHGRFEMEETESKPKNQNALQTAAVKTRGKK